MAASSATSTGGRLSALAALASSGRQDKIRLRTSVTGAKVVSRLLESENGESITARLHHVLSASLFYVYSLRHCNSTPLTYKSTPIYLAYDSFIIHLNHIMAKTSSDTTTSPTPISPFAASSVVSETDTSDGA